MLSTAQRHSSRSAGKPAWKLAALFPSQGGWTQTDYLSLDASLENQRQIELVNGSLEFLAMPTRLHERIVKYLFVTLLEFNRARGLGEGFFSGRKSKLWNGEIRLPDILFVLRENQERGTEEYCDGADLVMEVVSPGAKDRARDLVEKRRAYAKAGISEYWIIDPVLKQITVLKLEGKSYKSHGEFKKGQKAASTLLKGFQVDVTQALLGLKQ